MLTTLLLLSTLTGEQQKQPEFRVETNLVMLSMTAGSLLGHLARRSLGQYDLPVSRPPSDELLLVAPNVAEFGDAWSLPADDLRLWVCVNEVAHHAVLAVPHVGGNITPPVPRHLASVA